MPLPLVDQAIQDALRTGKAILKYISRNDVGDTGGHQCGYYLPRNAWQLFTEMPPEKGAVTKAKVQVVWSDGTVTNSVVTWYGKDTRREYRLTCFGRGFRFLKKDNVGNLLVIIPRDLAHFSAYVFESEDDIIAVQNALGVDLIGGKITTYENGVLQSPETENACIEDQLCAFVEGVGDFPSPADISEAARHALEHCISGLRSQGLDKRLVEAVETEYRLFKMVESRICTPLVTQRFPDIDAFLSTAQTILQRRKARAGLAFQNQVQALFEEKNVPFCAQPKKIDGIPDFIFPSQDAYLDRSFPAEKLTSLALKTTCKDRWRQVLQEASRCPRKHLLTLQGGISVPQLREMRDANVTLVVPKPLQKDYNAEASGVEILSFEEFTAKVAEAS
jgi:type II restriction enzyme